MIPDTVIDAEDFSAPVKSVLGRVGNGRGAQEIVQLENSRYAHLWYSGWLIIESSSLVNLLTTVKESAADYGVEISDQLLSELYGVALTEHIKKGVQP